MNLEQDKLVKVAIYTRVSTTHQVEEGFSLDAQKDRLIKYAESNGYTIYDIYEELGKSGKNTNRPSFQKMMQDMREKRFSKILVMKLDRISRSVADLENIIKELKKYKCDFESASEKIDTNSAMGLIFVRLLGIFAQFERERDSERIIDVFMDKVQKGQPITGNMPIGFKIESNGKEKRIVIDEEKSILIKDMYNTYELLSSLGKTCEYLNNTYPDLVYKGGFIHSDIKRIMKNTMYYGKYRNNDNYCPAIVTYEQWKKVNDMRENKNIRTEKKYTYLFSGIIRGTCGHTFGGRMFNSSRKGVNIKFAYRCSKYSNSMNKDMRCKKSNITEEAIEKRVIEMIPEEINNFISQYEKEYKQNSSKDNSKIIKNLEIEKKRIVNSYNKGWMSELDAENEITRIDEEIKKYSTTEKIDYSKLKELVSSNWLDYYDALSRENKQIFLRKIIDYIEVDVEKYRKGNKDFIKIHLIK